MGSRRRARELAIQVLFHMEYNPGDPGECFDRICECFEPPREVRAYAREVVLGVWEKKEELDQRMRRSSKNWRVERMSRVDRNILRLAIYEVLYRKDVPPKVSIDEAVELGKRYGTEESGAFINGILDHIYNELKAEEVEPQRV
ncbi:MAG: transcription antitermination factor NusB [Deltaproteobacteria bacterium]